MIRILPNPDRNLGSTSFRIKQSCLYIHIKLYVYIKLQLCLFCSTISYINVSAKSECVESPVSKNMMQDAIPVPTTPWQGLLVHNSGHH